MKKLKYYLLEKKYNELLDKSDFYDRMIDLYKFDLKEAMKKLEEIRKELKKYKEEK